MQFVLTDKLIDKAESYLKSCDIMSMLIKRHGPCQLANREFSPFNDLVSSIISQQLSAKAAATIKYRLITSVTLITPETLNTVSYDNLREAGLSAKKGRYIKCLANKVVSGQIDLFSMQTKSNEEILSILTALPGIGRWTAEMFLLFSLKRPNILATSDTGLQRAVRNLFGDSAKLDNFEKIWSPYCSVASWYLWKHIDS